MTDTILPPKTDLDASERSCSEMDLSWLSPRVLEAALDTKNLSLDDVDNFHESLRAAEEFGSMDHDTSERLHEKIEQKQQTLIDKMVAHETARVSRKLGIYQVLKTHKTWEQVHYMADMHGQGAYILMKDFKGLKTEDMEEALKPFHVFLDEKAKGDIRPIPLPYSKPEEAKYTKIDDKARPKVEPKVAEKLCKAYRRLYTSMHDKDTGGYDQSTLDRVLDYKPETVCELLCVTLPDEDDDPNGDQENVEDKDGDDDEEKRGGEMSD